MTDWYQQPVTSPETEPQEALQAELNTLREQRRDNMQGILGDSGVIALDAIGGPDEAATVGQIARGSIGYHTRENGFPRPIKQFRGIRLWDLDAIRAWRQGRD